MIPFQFKVFIKTFFQAFSLNAPWTLRRIGMTIFLFFLFPMLQVLNWFTLLLDEIFFRGYRKVEVKEPLFIVGNARSGTTYMHRLLSLNTQDFTTFKLYDILFISVTVKKIILAFAAIDSAIGAPFAKLLDKIQGLMFRGADKIHKLRLTKPEEDEGVMIHAFSTVYLALLVPVPAQEPFNKFDELPKELRMKLMSYYRRCVQRHLYCHGRGSKRLLSKNPLFCNKMDTVLEIFPDAKIVHMVRSPYESVASTHNMVDRIWNVQLQLPKEDARREPVMDVCIYSYKHTLEVLDRHDQNASIHVRYPNLVGDPRGTVEAIYDRFSIPISPEFARDLTQATERNKGYKSQHKYSLEQFGLTKDKVYNDLREVFERFDFKKEGEGQEDSESDKQASTA